MLQQKSEGMPVSISFYGASEVSTMRSSTDIESPVHFGVNPWHRVNYVAQILMAIIVSHFGILESPRDPITFKKILAAGLVVAGAFLSTG